MKKLSPQQANTESKILKLKRDNCDTPDFWILVKENLITITKQKSGQYSEGSIDIPRRVFNRFIKFYTTPQ